MRPARLRGVRRRGARSPSARTTSLPRAAPGRPRSSSRCIRRGRLSTARVRLSREKLLLESLVTVGTPGLDQPTLEHAPPPEIPEWDACDDTGASDGRRARHGGAAARRAPAAPRRQRCPVGWSGAGAGARTRPPRLPRRQPGRPVPRRRRVGPPAAEPVVRAHLGPAAHRRRAGRPLPGRARRARSCSRRAATPCTTASPTRPHACGTPTDVSSPARARPPCSCPPEPSAYAAGQASTWALRRAAAARAANRRRSSLISGCHCTPSTNAASGSSSTSTVPSAA